MLDTQYSNQAKKFLKKINKDVCKRILDKIEDLREDPFPRDLKRIANRKEKVFRIRVGENRILYVVSSDKNILFISKIDKRPKAYK